VTDLTQAADFFCAGKSRRGERGWTGWQVFAPWKRRLMRWPRSPDVARRQSRGEARWKAGARAN